MYYCKHSVVSASFWNDGIAQVDKDREDVGSQHWQKRRQKPIVAFSCGPYAACLADGSEYTGAYVDTLTFEQLVDFHRKKIQVNLYSR